MIVEWELYLEKWTRLRLRLLDECDPEDVSPRIYFLGSNWRNRVDLVAEAPGSYLDLRACVVLDPGV